MIKKIICIALINLFTFPAFANNQFSFNMGKVLSLANDKAKSYFASEYYSSRNYDQENPLVDSFVGKDCDQSSMNLVYVVFVPENPKIGVLWSVWKVTPDDVYTLMGEGPGAAKGIKELIEMWQDPDKRDCHHV